jgi:hypothetical protein
MLYKYRIARVLTVLASSSLAYLGLAGCTGNRELLEAPLAQSYFLPSPPLRVWRAALLEVSKPNRRMLANDEAAHLLSWVSEVEPDKRINESLTDPEVAPGNNETIAVTVVQVDGAPGGARLTIRRTYCSGKPFFGVSPSRGNYEQEVLRSIRSSLILEASSHVKNQ